MGDKLTREYASYPDLLWKLMKHKTVIYPQKVLFGEDKAQYFLHFAPPDGQKCDKVIFYIHGGGWNSSSPAALAFVGEYFAALGCHCVMPGYRKAPAHRCPDIVEDVCVGFKRAVEYLDGLGVDTGKLLICGSSAGAHLGALLCCDPQLQQRYDIDASKLCGFAGLAGVYCFSCEYPHITQRMLEGLFGDEMDRSLGEPYCKLNEQQTLPMLIIHSRWDEVAPYQNAVEFYNLALSLGVPCEFYSVTKEKSGHSAYSAGIFLEPRETCETLDKLLSWIEKI